MNKGMEPTLIPMILVPLALKMGVLVEGRFVLHYHI